MKRTAYVNSAWQSRYSVYDGDTLLGEVTSGTLVGTNVTRVFTWGAAGLVSKREVMGGNWQSRWYHFGAQGETRRVTDAGGAVTATLAYDAYGTGVGGGNGDALPFTYGGQAGYYDDSNGLYLCGARWYNPKLGRWLTRDPIGYGGGANLYEYCGNNPVMGVDPSGLQEYRTWGPGNTGFDPSSPLWADAGARKSLKQGSKGFLKGSWNFLAGAISPPKALVGGALQLPTFKPSNEIEAQVMGMTETGLFVGSLFCGSGEVSLARKAPAVISRIIKFLKGGGCFVAGTPVQMADGSTKPTEKMKEGDLVASRNMETGKTEAKRVTAVTKREVYELVRLELWDKTGKTSEVIVGTSEHPFFTLSGMVEMCKLLPGTEVVSRRGPPLVVKSVTVEKHPEGIAVYNFIVEGDHTYFVGTAQGGMWVHNNDCNYRKTYFDANPRYTPSNSIVHHAIEQQILTRHPGLFTSSEIHALSNLRASLTS